MSNERQQDSDVLLVTFELQRANLYLSGKCTLAASDGTEFPMLGTAGLKPPSATGSVDMRLLPPGLVGLYLATTSESGAATVLVFQLPPAPGRMALKGLGGFSSVMVDVK